MEHLESPANGIVIEIPYLPGKPYDGGDFLSYPSRAGWTEDELLGAQAFGQRPAGEAEAFFQTWLYFGSLHAVFKIGGIAVDAAQFVRTIDDGRQVVTTAALAALVREWIAHEGIERKHYRHLAPHFDRKKMDRSAKKRRGAQIDAILRRMRFFCRRYCDERAQRGGDGDNASSDNSEDDSDSSDESDDDAEAADVQHTPPFWPISPSVALSIIALGEALYAVSSAIYGFPDENVSFGTSGLLNQHLRDADWCPWELAEFGTSLDTLYYFASFPSPRRDLDHSRCTRVSCRARTVYIERYQTKHARDGCQCERVMAPKEVAEIVGRGGIPIVMWKDGELHATEYDEHARTRYVAISHVWSDGMGNEQQNSLPACQLSRLQDLVNRTYTEPHDFHRHPPIDLGDPENESVDGSEPCGDSTDDEMEDPPDPDADTSVGFWMDTLCVPVALDSLRKAAIRKMAAIYRSAHRVLVLDAYLQRIPRDSDITEKSIRVYLSNWSRRLWTLQEGLLARVLFFQFADGTQTLRDMNAALVAAKTDVARLYGDVRNIPESSFDLLYYYGHDLAAKAGTASRFGIYALQIQARTTSKAADEPLCFATVLGLDVGPLLEVQGEERTARLYEMVGLFDPEVIFNDFPRMVRDGFRWAPRSLLSQAHALAHGGEDATDRADARLQIGGGLEVAFPGLKLERVGAHLGRAFYVVPDKTQPFWPGRGDKSPNWAVVKLRADEEGGFPVWDPSARYAIVLSEAFDDGDGESVEAILATYHGRDKHGVAKVRHVARAKVRMPPQEELSEVKKRAKLFLRGKSKMQEMEEGFEGLYAVKCSLLGLDQDWRIY
ncbi:hypothetical protein WOLCODRAFT_138382 [Wolfiporia cocos MD-104 SS10]|uniref:Heterokaryon incompatibility domain-containing protein n=1 Tax=Wolfiporia cocos (strain MD-104) TaxID=742152 RepID=A0A2H3JMV1_WOLCO|nr:hypothetical protein WOLCODRAFT_138382 [Wolfiporia cocos MD-104 SS10]